MQRMRLVVAAAITIATMGLQAPPASATDAALDVACPDRAPKASYADVGDTTHARAIGCAQWWLVDAFGGSEYQPSRPATRAEIAGALALLLDQTGYANRGDSADQGFDDVDGNRYEQSINRLASLRIINGKTPNLFDPGGQVTRGQMAALIVRTVKDAIFQQPMPPGDGFDDTRGTTHEDPISRLVEAGITAGTTTSTFSPGDPVSRGQLATFLMRSVDLLARNGKAAVPDRSPAYLGYDLSSVDSSGFWKNEVAFVDGRRHVRALVNDEPTGGRVEYIEYDLGRDYSRFRATAGVSDGAADTSGNYQLSVTVDGSEKQRETMTYGTEYLIDVDVTDGLRLRIEVIDVDRVSGNIVVGHARVTSGTYDEAVVADPAPGPETLRLGYDRTNITSNGFWKTGPAALNGETYAQTLLNDEPTSERLEFVDYYLGRDYERFTATAGIHDSADANSRMIFSIKADGREVFRQELQLGQQANVDIAVSGVLRLRLEVFETSLAGGNAVFADAIVSRSPNPN